MLGKLRFNVRTVLVVDPVKKHQPIYRDFVIKNDPGIRYWSIMGVFYFTISNLAREVYSQRPHGIY